MRALETGSISIRSIDYLWLYNSDSANKLFGIQERFR
jgi:hypothetical protein